MNEQTQPVLEQETIVNTEPTEIKDEIINQENQESVEEVEQKEEGESKEEKKSQDGEGDEGEVKERTLVNRLKKAADRKDQKIRKMQEALAQYEQKLQGLTQQSQQDLGENFGLKEPNEDDFANYGDYLKELGKYEANLEIKQREIQAQQQAQAQSQQQYIQSRVDYINNRVAETQKLLPDLDSVYKENIDIIESYSDNVKMTFMEADKPELAFYALATEGKLESLNQMSPYRAAQEIAKAEIRGEQYIKERPSTKAPAPISKLRPSKAKTKSLADMKPTELIQYIQKNKR